MAEAERPPAWAVPLALLPCQVFGTYGAALGQAALRPLDAFGHGLPVLGPLLLTARRNRPVAVLAAVTAVTLLYHLCGYPVGPFFLALIAAVVAAMTGGPPG